MEHYGLRQFSGTDCASFLVMWQLNISDALTREVAFRFGWSD